MIKLEYLGSPAPAPARPPVTRELIAEIARVEPAVATNAIGATNDIATYATNDVATNAKAARTANRRTPEAYSEYQRSYMARRRAASKVTGPQDRASLAKAGA
jgi:hypothetical protein